MHLAGKHIAVEITEGILLHTMPSVDERLRAYRNAGVQVAIDDFGTGYSSMTYLQKFQIDYLKIDQSFIRDITSNPAHRTITETMILMAHKLGLKAIAEGIETEEQLSMLKEAGCDYGQGFLFSPPVPPESFERLLGEPPETYVE
jgi:EAL domain-containing protein (putative c-di-GMP-specific phosphodiesterase class I)